MKKEAIRSAMYKYGNYLVKKIRTRSLFRNIDKFGLVVIGREFDLLGLKFEMLINMKDKGLSMQLIRNDWREYNSTKYFINEFLQEDEVVIELGANIGYFALIEAAKSPRNKIYAVEPVLDNFKILSANVALNNYNNITCLNTGISDKSGSLTIAKSDHLNWCTFDEERKLEMKESESYSEEEIEVFSLEDFINNKVDEDNITLIRMDIEGYEYTVLMNSEEILRKYRPRLFIEFHSNLLGKDKSIKFLRMLSSVGYEIKKVIYNLEYCRDDLVFKQVSWRGKVLDITIDEYISILDSKDDSVVRQEEGVELFLV
jgi:FkbM family methyltransferase